MGLLAIDRPLHESEGVIALPVAELAEVLYEHGQTSVGQLQLLDRRLCLPVLASPTKMRPKAPAVVSLAVSRSSGDQDGPSSAGVHPLFDQF